MKIEYTKNTRGDYSAEISLNSVSSHITGGSLYAYGADKEDAKGNLYFAIKDVIAALSEIVD